MSLFGPLNHIYPNISQYISIQSLEVTEQETAWVITQAAGNIKIDRFLYVR